MAMLDLSFGLVSDSLDRAAPEDLTLLTDEFPFDSDQTGIFLKNNNKTQGIVAAIRIDGAVGYRVDSVDRTVSHPRWPLRFEARVPQGSVLLLAPSAVNYVRGLYPDHVDTVTVRQQVTIEGAYYRNPPYPDDPAPDSFIRVYSASIHGGDEWNSLDFMVNLHNSRCVRIKAEPVKSDGALRVGTPLPGLHMLWDQWSGPRAWRIAEAKYFP